jgi:glycosyltransferase involved in cell wall biosynthesis
VSSRDAQATRELLPRGSATRVAVAPNGVDVQRITPRSSRPAGMAPTVLFTGTSARRNLEGLRWFLARCWAHVRARVPTARFLIAGDLARAKLARLAGDAGGVEVVTGVQRMEDVLAAADVAVVPVRLGGGTKIKVIEAMAAGLGVVVTPEAARGLDALDGRDLLVRQQEVAYVEAVVDLLTDETRRRRLGEAARRYVVEHHDWDAIASVVERDLVSAAGAVSRGRDVAEGA